MIGGQEGISPELEEKIHEMQVRVSVTFSEGSNAGYLQVLEKFMSSIPENTNYQQQVRCGAGSGCASQILQSGES